MQIYTRFMDKPDQTPPRRTPSLALLLFLKPCRYFLFLPLSFCPLASQSGLPEMPGEHTERGARGMELQEPRSGGSSVSSALPGGESQCREHQPGLSHGTGEAALREHRCHTASKGPGPTGSLRLPGNGDFGTARGAGGVPGQARCRMGLTLGPGAWPRGNCRPRTAEGGRHSLSISIPGTGGEERRGESHPRKHKERR